MSFMFSAILRRLQAPEKHRINCWCHVPYYYIKKTAPNSKNLIHCPSHDKTLTCHLIQASEVGAFFEDFFFHLVIVHLYELLFILHNLVSF
jgi:hypothetical protein